MLAQAATGASSTRSGIKEAVKPTWHGADASATTLCGTTYRQRRPWTSKRRKAEYHVATRAPASIANAACRASAIWRPLASAAPVQGHHAVEVVGLDPDDDAVRVFGDGVQGGEVASSGVGLATTIGESVAK